MTLAEIIAQFRAEIQDVATPYFVSDTEAKAFANEAEVEACRRARLLVDSTTDDVAIVAVTAGDPMVALSPLVISIRRIRLASASQALRKATVRDMDEAMPGWDTSTNQSRPSIVITDYQSDSLRLHSIPNANDSLRMTVTREPLTAMSADAHTPEIPARYHMSLIHWMRYRAYMKEDSDLFDPKAGATALGLFEQEFGTRSSAKNERFEFENYHDIGEA